MTKRKIVKRAVARTRKPAVPTFQVIGVNFSSSLKVYHYKAPMSWDVEYGDRIIVDSPSGGYTVVKVVCVTPKADLSDYIPLKWAVSQIDDAAYRARVQRDNEERELLMKIERRRRLEAQIDALARELALI